MHTIELHRCANFEEIYVGEKANIIDSSEEVLSNGYLQGLIFQNQMIIITPSLPVVADTLLTYQIASFL